MKKWTVKADFIIQADSRGEAWSKANELMKRHFRGLISIRAVSSLSNPQDWIAVNEPIKS